MAAFLTVIHALICIFLIISILLQASKGGGLAGMFGGGGGMGNVFGGRGAASFLSKVTMWLAVGFGIMSLIIALISIGGRSRQRSLVEQVMEQEQVSSPATMLPTVPGVEEAVQEQPAPEQQVPPETEKDSK